MFKHLSNNPFMKYNKFVEIANEVIKDKHLEFKMFDSTYKSMYNKIKKELNINNEAILEQYLLIDNGEEFYRKSILFNKYDKKKVLICIKYIYGYLS